MLSTSIGACTTATANRSATSTSATAAYVIAHTLADRLVVATDTATSTATDSASLLCLLSSCWIHPVISIVAPCGWPSVWRNSYPVNVKIGVHIGSFVSAASSSCLCPQAA
jgi:hypothetical protein